MPAFTLPDLLTDEYRALLTQKHDKRSWGGTGKNWVELLESYLRVYPKGATLLDYGCGRGTFKEELAKYKYLQFDVREYDPGVRGKDALPEPADIVICTDVLEHVEPKLIDHVLTHIKLLVRVQAFFVIPCVESNSSLPDGRNTHILVRPPDWWKCKLDGAFPHARFRWFERTPNRLVVLVTPR